MNAYLEYPIRAFSCDVVPIVPNWDYTDSAEARTAQSQNAYYKAVLETQRMKADQLELRGLMAIVETAFRDEIASLAYKNGATDENVHIQARAIVELLRPQYMPKESTKREDNLACKGRKEGKVISPVAINYCSSSSLNRDIPGITLACSICFEACWSKTIVWTMSCPTCSHGYCEPCASSLKRCAVCDRNGTRSTFCIRKDEKADLAEEYEAERRILITYGPWVDKEKAEGFGGVVGLINVVHSFQRLIDLNLQVKAGTRKRPREVQVSTDPPITIASKIASCFRDRTFVDWSIEAILGARPAAHDNRTAGGTKPREYIQTTKKLAEDLHLNVQGSLLVIRAFPKVISLPWFPDMTLARVQVQHRAERIGNIVVLVRIKDARATGWGFGAPLRDGVCSHYRVGVVDESAISPRNVDALGGRGDIVPRSKAAPGVDLTTLYAFDVDGSAWRCYTASSGGPSGQFHYMPGADSAHMQIGLQVQVPHVDWRKDAVSQEITLQVVTVTDATINDIESRVDLSSRRRALGALEWVDVTARHGEGSTIVNVKNKLRRQHMPTGFNPLNPKEEPSLDA